MISMCKTTLKLLVHVLAIMANSYLKIVFSQKSGLNPHPPPPPPPLKVKIAHFLFLLKPTSNKTVG